MQREGTSGQLKAWGPLVGVLQGWQGTQQMPTASPLCLHPRSFSLLSALLTPTADSHLLSSRLFILISLTNSFGFSQGVGLV